MAKAKTTTVPRTVRTEDNKARRMAAHAKRYPKTSTKTAAERRALGRHWKVIAEQRIDFGTRS